MEQESSAPPAAETPPAVRALYLASFAVLAAALFVNLGLIAIKGDEGFRAGVAYEMMLRDDYIAAERMGEPYTRKPPLYNWILAAVFEAAGGEPSEWLIRAPAVVALLLFGLTVFWAGRRAFNLETGFLAGMGLIVTFRMLFFESLLGHIDNLFSWVVFCGFLALYYFSRRERWLLMFGATYFLAAVAFMLKGLPAVAFQGLSLVAWLGVLGRWRLLFGWRHFAGALAFAAPVGAYFVAVHLRADLLYYFEGVVDEAVMRTPLDEEIGLWDSVKHLFYFPVSVLEQLLPFSVLTIFWFKKDFWRQCWRHPFAKFCLVIIAANILVYWVSPRSKPRYLFMFYPLFLYLWFYGYQLALRARPRLRRVVSRTAAAALFLLAAASLGAFLPEIGDDPARVFLEKAVPAFYAKAALVFATLAAAALQALKWPRQALALFITGLVVARLAFGWFVLPQRHAHNFRKPESELARRIGQITKGAPLYYHGANRLHNLYGYYVTVAREAQMERLNEPPPPGAYYIAAPGQFEGARYEKILTFKNRWKKRELWLTRILPPENADSASVFGALGNTGNAAGAERR